MISAGPESPRRCPVDHGRPVPCHQLGRVKMSLRVGRAERRQFLEGYRLSGLTQRQVGTRYGGISSQAVSLARKRAKSRWDG